MVGCGPKRGVSWVLEALSFYRFIGRQWVCIGFLFSYVGQVCCRGGRVVILVKWLIEFCGGFYELGRTRVKFRLWVLRVNTWAWSSQFWECVMRFVFVNVMVFWGVMRSVLCVCVCVRCLFGRLLFVAFQGILLLCRIPLFILRQLLSIKLP